MFFKRFIRQLLLAEQVLDLIQQKMETIMATAQNFKDLVVAINAETDRLAAKIQAFIDAENAGGLTPAEEEAHLADLQSVVDRLKVVGANPADPIPPVEEPPAEI